MISIKDVAAACGVSISTVSKALNDHKDVSQSKRNISDRKRRKWGILRIHPRGHSRQTEATILVYCLLMGHRADSRTIICERS